MKIILLTVNGQFVKEFQGPNFAKIPEVIKMGERTFLLFARNGDKPLKYVECTSYNVPI